MARCSKRRNLLLFVLLIAGCNAVGGILEGVPVAVDTCRMAPKGTPLPNQSPGDCRVEVCDGDGSTITMAAPTDYDDGNPCTEDRCDGIEPVHVPIDATVPCYSGDAWTRNVGECNDGQQICQNGQAVGPCIGEVLPTLETCDEAATDEDCDGLVNEQGAGCYCGDGILQTLLGEECDDGDTTADAVCSAMCRLNRCGDGIVQASESCDDGNTVDDDGCPATCRDPIIQVVASRATSVTLFTCALFARGQLKCWGLHPAVVGNDIPGDGSNEMGANLAPIDLGTNATTTSVTAGESHLCALQIGGRVQCWGANDKGQLGAGDTEFRGDELNELGDALPQVDLGAVAEALSAGSDHTCALCAGGKVKCWGANQFGQLGLGDTNNRGDEPGEMGAQLPYVDLGMAAVAIAAGGLHTCALLVDGTIRCWGYNSAGQLGLGDTNPRGAAPNQMGANLPPVALGTNAIATAITAGNSHNCALLANASIKCWGDNTYGQLGLGDSNARGDDLGEMGDALASVSLGIAGIAISSSAGAYHTCARLADASIKCWGANFNGALGIGNIVHIGQFPGQLGDALAPVDLGTTSTTTAVVAGGTHTCAILANDTLKCWGDNTVGQLGLGDNDDRGDEPDEMGNFLPPVELW